MEQKLLREWKKVELKDLSYIAYEVKSLVSVPCVIFLEGPLGAGKTSFTKVFTNKEDETSSPSYSLLNEVGDILHGDFYRVKSKEELIHLELELYLEDKNYVFLEWGLQYFSFLESEISEDFSFFLLKISVDEEKSDLWRHYELYRIRPSE